MQSQPKILGVYLSDLLDLDALYGEALAAAGPDVVLKKPAEIDRPEDVRFAICWLPGEEAFAPYPNLEMAMSIGAGVDALLAHPGLDEAIKIARVRDPHQADLMAGFAAHEILNRERGFDRMMENAAVRNWAPLPMRAPATVKVAVLGHGTMGQAVVAALSGLGFELQVACRTAPQSAVAGVTYCTGDTAIQQAASGADYLVNVLPLTPSTENILGADLFARLAPGAWLVQIGRGEHLVEADLTAAIDKGTLSGATLDVFREEPLPQDHPFWINPALRITPHVASDSMPEFVAAQVVETARELRDGKVPALSIDRKRGY